MACKAGVCECVCAKARLFQGAHRESKTSLCQGARRGSKAGLCQGAHMGLSTLRFSRTCAL